MVLFALGSFCSKRLFRLFPFTQAFYNLVKKEPRPLKGFRLYTYIYMVLFFNSQIFRVLHTDSMTFFTHSDNCQQAAASEFLFLSFVFGVRGIDGKWANR